MTIVIKAKLSLSSLTVDAQPMVPQEVMTNNRSVLTGEKIVSTTTCPTTSLKFAKKKNKCQGWTNVYTLAHTVVYASKILGGHMCRDT